MYEYVRHGMLYLYIRGFEAEETVTSVVEIYRWHLSRIVTGLSRILEVLLTAFGKIERDHVFKITIATLCNTNNTICYKMSS